MANALAWCRFGLLVFTIALFSTWRPRPPPAKGSATLTQNLRHGGGDCDGDGDGDGEEDHVDDVAVPQLDRASCLSADAHIMSEFEAAVKTALRYPGNQEGNVRLVSNRTACMEARQANRKRCDAAGVREFNSVLWQYCTQPPLEWPAEAYAQGPTEPELEALTQECRNRSFLLWTRNMPDYFAGFRHAGYAFSCQVAEAITLNRTLVLDDFKGLVGDHTDGNKSHKVEMPFNSWKMLASLERLPAGAILWSEFSRTCGTPGMLLPPHGATTWEVLPKNTSEERMLASSASLLVRDWSSTELLHAQPRWGFETCHGGLNLVPLTENVFGHQSEPYFVGFKAQQVWKRVLDSQETKSPERVVCLHIRRGDKLEHASDPSPRWTHLEENTSPLSVLHTVEQRVPEGYTLYLATNQPHPDEFYAALKTKYRVFSLSSFPDLIDPDKWLGMTFSQFDYKILNKCTNLLQTFWGEKSRGIVEGLSLTNDTKPGGHRGDSNGDGAYTDRGAEQVHPHAGPWGLSGPPPNHATAQVESGGRDGSGISTSSVHHGDISG